MKPASSNLSAYLDATTVGWWVDLYEITPKGLSTLYYTTHTAAITVNSKTYNPPAASNRPLLKTLGRRQQAGLDPGEFRFAMLAPGSTEGLWGTVKVQRAAIDGAFDGAWVRVERIFGATPGTPDTANGTLPIHEGPVAEVKPSSVGVEFRVSDGREELTRIFPGRIIQPGCNWRFGSTECGISLASHTVNGTLNYTGSHTASRVYSSDLGGFAEDYLAHGTITFSTGNVAGLSRGIVAHHADGDNSYVDLDRPLPEIPDTEDDEEIGIDVDFTAVAGCPKTLAACGHNGTNGKFGVVNSANFGGFPFLPKPSSVVST